MVNAAAKGHVGVYSPAATRGHVDVCGLCCSRGLLLRSMWVSVAHLAPEAMLMSMACAAATGYDGV